MHVNILWYTLGIQHEFIFISNHGVVVVFLITSGKIQECYFWKGKCMNRAVEAYHGDVRGYWSL